MNIKQALFAHLSNHAGLKALIGTRIYPKVLPQDAILPAVTYQKISGPTQYVMDGATSIKRPLFQVDAWDSTVSGVEAVGEQIKAALDRFAGIMGGAGGVNIIGTWLEDDGDDYEPDTKRHRVSLDYRFEHL